MTKIKSGSFQLKMQAIELAASNTRIPPLSLKVFTRLVKHHNMKTGQCNPSIGTLARALGASERGVRGAIRQLEKHGLIETQPGGGRHRSNDYIIPTLNTRQTRNASTRNPERMVSNTRNVHSPETIKETNKKRRDDRAASKPKYFGRILSDGAAENKIVLKQGQIQKQLADMIGINGWEILVDQSELCGNVCEQISNNEISPEEAVKLLLAGT